MSSRGGGSRERGATSLWTRSGRVKSSPTKPLRPRSSYSVGSQMRNPLYSLFSRATADPAEIDAIHRHRDRLAALDESALRTTFRQSTDLLEVIAIVAITASRVLGLDMFDVQFRG